MPTKILRGVLALGLGLAGFFPVLLAADKPAAAKAKADRPAPMVNITRLAWLAGTWRMEKGGRLMDEQWMMPAGGVMLGMGRTVAKGREIEHEFLQIREGPGGELYYVALPSGQAEATFKATALTDNAVVFENKEHDFPQAIGYSRGPDETLLAYVEGPGSNGESKRIEFVYRRMP